MANIAHAFLGLTGQEIDWIEIPWQGEIPSLNQIHLEGPAVETAQIAFMRQSRGVAPGDVKNVELYGDVLHVDIVPSTNKADWTLVVDELKLNRKDFTVKTRTADENDIYSYGFAFTSGDLDGAVSSLSDVFPDMLKLAEVEKSCQLMAAEIEKTRRRVNALEHVIIPETQESIKYITMKLDENERSTQVRLMKVKSMMLEEAHHYSEKE